MTPKIGDYVIAKQDLYYNQFTFHVSKGSIGIIDCLVDKNIIVNFGNNILRQSPIKSMDDDYVIYDV